MQTPDLSDFSKLIFEKHMQRKTKKQKEAFRKTLVPELERLGWPVHIHSTNPPLRSHNVVAGDVEAAEYIFTAHYDTPAVMLFLNFLAPLNLPLSLLYQFGLAVVLLAIIGALFFALSTVLESGLLALAICYVALFGLIYLLMAGPANRNNANDNTSGVLTLLEIASELPPELRQKTALVFFDNEEKGLVGSYCFSRQYPAAKQKPLINFDCVGDGDTFLFVAKGQLRNDIVLQEKLKAAFFESGPNACQLTTSSFAQFPSDQAMFARGIAVAALNKAPIVGLYVARIHTNRDIICKADNIRQLSRGAVRLVQG